MTMEVKDLRHFDKCLVRDDAAEVWRLGIFECAYGSTFLCVNGEFKYCIPYEGNEYLWFTTDEPGGDLSIDTAVMCNSGADKEWVLRYYAGGGEVWRDGLKSSDKVGASGWYHIIPLSSFSAYDVCYDVDYGSAQRGKA